MIELGYFEVTTENLQVASDLLWPGTGPGALASGGAAAGTPVAGAWSEFVNDADRAIQNSHQTISGLSRALSLAAQMYAIAEQSAICSLQTKG